MTPDRWRMVNDLVQRALGMEPAQRPAFVREWCADDASLMEKVLRLLRECDEVGDFLEVPVQSGVLIAMAGSPRTPVSGVGAGSRAREKKEIRAAKNGLGDFGGASGNRP